LPFLGQDKQEKESLNNPHYEELDMKYKMMPKCVFFLGFLLFSGFYLFLRAAGEPQTGQRENQSYYSTSYALIIGISEYENKEKWPYLENALKDGLEVGKELDSRGFDVTYNTNITLSELERALKEFFYNEKIDNQSRLFLWHSGHGHTIRGEGFLVPADAPGPDNDGFIRNALPVKRFEEYSQYTKAKHVYMVFDSCFSSTIFKESSSKSTSTAYVKKNQVRQFLCSCKQGQKRQDNHHFRNSFLKAIRNEAEANYNKDGYLTATELGQFIKQQIDQIPYYGRLKGFDQGDFVFILPGKQRSGFFHDFLKDGNKGPEMSEVRKGPFLMGTYQGGGYENETPQHVVEVGSIAVGRFEVTFEDYDRFCEAVGRIKPYDNKWGRGNRPVINVSWEDARAYTRWLSEQTGYTYRLPTEAEWEYMARAGTETNYWWGNEPGQNNASCDGCGAKWGWDAERKTAPVGSFAPNPFGIYDTVGNVWEWTCSEYTDTYIGKETKCLDKITNPWQLVVIRGGAWDEPPVHCRAARRKSGYPGERSQYIGFRVVKILK
jgi:formylglycine-generating enzyme required for sulfatase activity